MCLANRSSPAWFDAARAENTQLDLNPAMLRTAEKRKPKPGIYPGFLAIHYAALSGNRNAIETLLSSEGPCGTQKDVIVKAVESMNNSLFQLPAGFLPLHLALVSQDNKDIVDLFISWEAEQQQLLKTPDGDCTLHLLALRDQIPGKYTLDLLLKQIIIENRAGQTAIELAASLAKTNFFKRVLEMLLTAGERSQQALDTFKKLVDKRGKEILRTAEEPVSGLYRISDEAKQTTATAAKELTSQDAGDFLQAVKRAYSALGGREVTESGDPEKKEETEISGEVHVVQEVAINE